MKKTLLTIAATAVVTSLFWIGAIAVAYLWQTQSKPPFQVSAAYPHRLKVGDTASLKLEVTNPSDKTVVLDSVDAYRSLTKGVKLTGKAPESYGQEDILNFTSYSFSESLGPGETVTVEFEIEALKKGHFTGDLDVCNPDQDFTSTQISIVIE